MTNSPATLPCLPQHPWAAAFTFFAAAADGALEQMILDWRHFTVALFSQPICLFLLILFLTTCICLQIPVQSLRLHLYFISYQFSGYFLTYLICHRQNKHVSFLLFCIQALVDETAISTLFNRPSVLNCLNKASGFSVTVLVCFLTMKTASIYAIIKRKTNKQKWDAMYCWLG